MSCCRSCKRSVLRKGPAVTESTLADILAVEMNLAVRFSCRHFARADSYVQSLCRYPSSRSLGPRLPVLQVSHAERTADAPLVLVASPLGHAPRTRRACGWQAPDKPQMWCGLCRQHHMGTAVTQAHDTAAVKVTARSSEKECESQILRISGDTEGLRSAPWRVD